ncbi:hypothetical protein WJX79_009223 [Trebouxia sp. C0005]
MFKASTAHAARCVLTTNRPRIALAVQHWECHRHTAPLSPRIPGQRRYHKVQTHAPRSEIVELPPERLTDLPDYDLPDYDLPDSADEDVTDIEAVLTPAPPEQAPPEQELGLVPSKEGYHAIKLEGCEFLLATTADGKLDLSDVYVQDDESGIYAQPDVSGGTIPESPQLYSEIEWREQFLGDVVYDKPPMILVKMVYLIHVAQHEPRRLDLTNVWILHAANRSIYKAVVDIRTETQDPAEMVLRIRRDGSLLVDHAQVMPTPDELILQEEFGHTEERPENIADPDNDLNDPIDAIEDDFDEPDVPAVDLA